MLAAGVPGPGSGHAGDRLRGVRWLATAAVACTLLLIAMGGAVRATDSGLACPDWPACYGQWIPPADLNMWLEHSHRLWAGVVGLLVLWLTAWTLLRLRDRPALWALASAALVLIVVQAGLGAAVVLLHLRAGLVTSHLGMSLVVVGCLIWLAVLARPDADTPATPTVRRVGRWSAVLALLVFAQALLGSQSTGRGAAYVFNAVPIWLTDDQWTGHVREWLHVLHRGAGYLVAAAVVVYALAIRRVQRQDPTTPAWTGRIAWMAVLLVSVQVALGITNVLTRATVASAIAHLAVASWLWAVLVLAAALGSPRTTPRHRRPNGDAGGAADTPDATDRPGAPVGEEITT